MNVEIKGTTYAVHWDYHRKDRNKSHKGDMTTCRIINSSGTNIARGVATLSESDNFNKNQGRKTSLTRALKNLSILTKDERRFFWEAYSAMTNSDWKKISKTLQL